MNLNGIEYFDNSQPLIIDRGENLNCNKNILSGKVGILSLILIILLSSLSVGAEASSREQDINIDVYSGFLKVTQVSYLYDYEEKVGSLAVVNKSIKNSSYQLMKKRYFDKRWKSSRKINPINSANRSYLLLENVNRPVKFRYNVPIHDYEAVKFTLFAPKFRSQNLNLDIEVKDANQTDNYDYGLTSLIGQWEKKSILTFQNGELNVAFNESFSSRRSLKNEKGFYINPEKDLERGRTKDERNVVIEPSYHGLSSIRYIFEEEGFRDQDSLFAYALIDDSTIKVKDFSMKIGGSETVPINKKYQNIKEGCEQPSYDKRKVQAYTDNRVLSALILTFCNPKESELPLQISYKIQKNLELVEEGNYSKRYKYKPEFDGKATLRLENTEGYSITNVKIKNHTLADKVRGEALQEDLNLSSPLTFTIISKSEKDAYDRQKEILNGLRLLSALFFLIIPTIGLLVKGREDEVKRQSAINYLKGPISGVLVSVIITLSFSNQLKLILDPFILISASMFALVSIFILNESEKT